MVKFKETIKAQYGGYRILHYKDEKGNKKHLLCDGEYIIDDKIEILTYQEHLEQLEDNECYSVYEYFKTRKGTKCAYTEDTEILQTYVVIIEKGEKK